MELAARGQPRGLAIEDREVALALDLAEQVQAVVGDLHSCPLPPQHGPSVSPFLMGSATLMIGGRPALRVGDTCICGASAAVGNPLVVIG